MLAFSYAIYKLSFACSILLSLTVLLACNIYFSPEIQFECNKMDSFELG